MVLPLLARALPTLFRAGQALLPSVSDIRRTTDAIDDARGAYEALTAVATRFYGTVIGSNLELQQIIRQSSIVIAAQTNALSATGDEVESFDQKLALISPRIKQIQREIELTTRDIVGATDAQTNAILNQTISQFSKLQGQTKEFSDELSAVPTLVANLTSAFNTFQIPDFQIPQEIRSLLQGDLNNPDSQLARQLQATGLTKEAFQEAQAQGRLIDLLIEKTEAFAEANKSGADTIENSFSIIKDITEQLFRSIGEDPTSGLQQGLTKVVEIINDPEFEENLKGIATAFGGPVGEAIETAFSRATAALKSFFGNLSTEEIEGFANNLGELLGDAITIITDVSITIGIVAAQIVRGVNAVFEAVDRVVDLAGSLNIDNLKSIFNLDISPSIDSASTEAKIAESLDELERELNSKGLLRKTFEFILGITPFGAAQNSTRFFEINDVKESFENSLNVLRSEIDATKPQIDFLLDIGARIAEVDTSDVEAFKVNGLAPLQEEINRLAEQIEFSKLSDDVAQEIRDTLDSIVGLSDFEGAQREITRIVTQAQIGTEDELKRFQQYQLGLQSRIDALKNLENELTTSANESNFTSEVADQILEIREEIVRLTSAQDDIAVASSSAVLAQQKLIDELDATGQSSEDARKKLEELKVTAASTQGAELSFGLLIDQGSTLTKVFDDLSSAVSKYATTAGDTPEIAAQDFEALLKAVQAAEDFGGANIRTLVDILQSAATDSTLKIEQRLQAQQALIALIEKETNLKSSLLDVEREALNLALETGRRSSEDFAVLSGRIDIKEKELQIQSTLDQLSKLELVRSNGAADQIQARVDAKEDLLALAEGEQRLQLEAELSQLRQLQAQSEAESIQQQELQTKLQLLEAEKETLIAKEAGLIIDNQLAIIARAKEDINARLQKVSAERELEISKLRESGAISAEIALRRQEESLKVSTTQLQIVQAEIAARQQLDTSNLSLDQKRQVQAELNSLITEELQLQSQLINGRLDLEAAIEQALIQRQQLLISTQSSEINATEAVNSSIQKIKDSILEAQNAQRDFLALTVALQDSVNQSGVIKLNLELGGIDRINQLEERLAKSSGEAESSALRDAIEQTKSLLGIQDTGLKAQLANIQKRGELEQALADSTFNLKLGELDLEREIAQIKLEGANTALETEKARIILKSEELALEKQSIQAKVNAGDLDQSLADRQLEAVNSLLDANQKVATSINNQTASNNKQISQLDNLSNTKKEILTNEKQSQDSNREITNAYEQQDRILDNVKSDTSAISSDLAQASQSAAQVSDAATNTNFSRLGTQKDGGSFVTGNAFGVEVDLSEVRRLSDQALAIRVPFNSRGTKIDSKEFKELQDLNDQIFIARERAQIKFQQDLAEAKEREFGDLLNPGRDSSSTGSGRTISTPTNVGQTFTSQTGGGVVNIDEAITRLTNEIFVLRTGPQTPEALQRLDGLTDILQSLLETQQTSNGEQISLLDAIRQGAFQNGGFRPETSQNVLINPETGELIISGTRPDTEKLDELVALDLGNLIAQRQLEALQGIQSSLGGSLVGAPSAPDLSARRALESSIRANGGISSGFSGSGGGGGSSSGSASTGSGFIAPRNQAVGESPDSGRFAQPSEITNIVNNFFPDQAGSINSQLRTAGL